MVKKAIKSNWARTEGNLSEALVKSLTIDGTEKEGEVMRPRDKLPSMCSVARTQEGKVQGSTLICIGIADYKMDLRFEAARLWKEALADVWGKMEIALERLKFPDSGTGPRNFSDWRDRSEVTVSFYRKGSEDTAFEPEELGYTGLDKMNFCLRAVVTPGDIEAVNIHFGLAPIHSIMMMMI